MRAVSRACASLNNDALSLVGQKCCSPSELYLPEYAMNSYRPPAFNGLYIYPIVWVLSRSCRMYQAIHKLNQTKRRPPYCKAVCVEPPIGRLLSYHS